MEIWSSPQLHTAAVLMQPQVLMNMAIHLWALCTMTLLSFYCSSLRWECCEHAGIQEWLHELPTVHMPVTICPRLFSFLWLLWAYIVLLALLIWWNALWDDLTARVDVGKVEVLLLSGPAVGFDLKERSPWLQFSWASQWQSLSCFCYLFLSLFLPSHDWNPFKDLELASMISSSIHTKGRHFVFLCSDRSLFKRMQNIRILRNRHSNVSSHYICYKWVVVEYILFSNLAQM